MDTYKQLFMLLNVLHSFIPEECIVETGTMKPKINAQTGGLELLQQRIPLTEEEARNLTATRKMLAGKAMDELPFGMPILVNIDEEAGASDWVEQEMDEDAEFVRQRLSSSRNQENGPRGGNDSGQKFQLRIVDVADIYLVPVCVRYKEGTAGARSTPAMNNTKKKRKQANLAAATEREKEIEEEGEEDEQEMRDKSGVKSNEKEDQSLG